MRAKLGEVPKIRIAVINYTSTSSHIAWTKTALSLDGARDLGEIMDAARRENPDVIALCHGDPILSLDDATYILKRFPAIDGFHDSTLLKRLPTETATDQVREFSNQHCSNRGPRLDVR